jgi:hypothetical protein
VSDLGELRESFKGKCPEVRAAYRILGAGHKSVVGLAGALDDLEAARRGANSESRGRAAARETDLLRSMIVFTSSALDASMQRLVNDVGRAMLRHAGSAAREQYKSHLSQMLPKSSFDEELKQPVIKEEPTDALLDFYFRQKTKARYH